MLLRLRGAYEQVNTVVIWPSAQNSSQQVSTELSDELTKVECIPLDDLRPNHATA